MSASVEGSASDSSSFDSAAVSSGVPAVEARVASYTQFAFSGFRSFRTQPLESLSADSVRVSSKRNPTRGPKPGQRAPAVRELGVPRNLGQASAMDDDGTPDGEQTAASPNTLAMRSLLRMSIWKIGRALAGLNFSRAS